MKRSNLTGLTLAIICEFLTTARKKARKYARRNPKVHQAKKIVDARGWFIKMNTKRRKRMLERIFS